MSDLPVLSFLVVAPLVGALVVAFLPRGNDHLAKVVTLGLSLVLLAVTIAMCASFVAGGERFQFVESYEWIPQFGTRIALGVDGIALVMLALVAVLVPLIAGAFFIAGLSSLALPGTGSFVAEFLVLVGTFTVNKPVAIVATVGIILAALYILLMYQRTMQGPLNPTLPTTMRDMTAREAWVIAPVLALVIALGVYPKPLLDVITPAVTATLSDIGRSDPAPTATDGGGE